MTRGQVIKIIAVLMVVCVALIFCFRNIDEEVSEKEYIQISNVKAGQAIKSPMLIQGVVTGGKWAGFEGQVGKVELIDSGKVIGSAPLITTSDFMKFPTSFEAELSFSDPKGDNIFLIFSNENPSGLSEGAETMILPVKVLNGKNNN